ncbi:MAG: hypothetical protein R6V40_00175, partial [Candidatus Moraniibacteriota bacterium]
MKKLQKLKSKLFLSLMLLGLFAGGIAYAVTECPVDGTCYRVDDYEEELVDLTSKCGESECYYVENNNCFQDALFVPTNTCSEWNKFKSYHPSCADLTESYHEYKSCYNDDVWWYDACDVREDKYEDCGSSYCDTGGYPEGTGDVNKYCSGGDVWGEYDYANKGCSGSSCYLDWDYNSCGHEKLEDCGSNYCDTSGDKDYYCSGGDVWVRYDYYEAGCSGASCYGDWDYNSCGHEKEEDCSGSTSCGYGSCDDDERPSWGCSGGDCEYSCSYDSDCEPEPDPEPDCETCSSLGVECGSHDDGCGGTISCGSCSGSTSCG